MLPLAVGTVGCGGFLLHKEGIGGCWEESEKEEEGGVRIRKRGSREGEGREGDEPGESLGSQVGNYTGKL